jgi:uncharacterized small protein (DUF1192 family)
MKTVFKGTINGKEFNSVEEYNKEMRELLSKGESINASSSTQVVNETETSASNIEEKIQTPLEESSEDSEEYTCMLPYFDDPEFHYLDDTISADENENSKVLNDIINDLTAAKEDILEVMDDMTLADIKEYAKSLNNVLAKIGSDNTLNQEAINIIDERIAKHSEEIAKLQNELNKFRNDRKALVAAKKIINTMNNFYSDLVNETNKCSFRPTLDCPCEHEDKKYRTESIRSLFKELGLDCIF